MLRGLVQIHAAMIVQVEGLRKVVWPCAAFRIECPNCLERTSTLPSLTIENYLKTIYQICARQEGALAATGKVAEALGVAPGTVTSMLKTLSDTGLAEYRPYEGVTLTDSGRALALRVLRRHRLIELFLSTTLDLTWDEVHDEAENMEHAVSDYLVDRIDKYLGFPAVDPHGDPIPKADGTVSSPAGRTLADWGSTERFRLVRVIDQSPEFLRYLSDIGLPLGAEGHVCHSRSEAGIICVDVGAGEITLALDAARRLLVGLAS